MKGFKAKRVRWEVDLVEGWQNTVQAGAVEQVLEVGHYAVQQHIWLGGHHCLGCCNGVCRCQAVALMLYQLPHSRHQLLRTHLLLLHITYPQRVSAMHLVGNIPGKIVW